MYRFLLSARWIGLALLMVVGAAAMVGLGLWQLDRYYTRTEINNRIDSAAERPATALTEAMVAPSPAKAGVVGPVPSEQLAWTMVTVTGRYDAAHEILARARTVNSDVGFEVITPLVLADGTAVLVDRGWIAASERGASEPPNVPPPPAGEVTVTGRIHAPETRADAPEPFGKAKSVRHVAPQQIAPAVPYALYGAYVTLETQSPPAAPAFVPIPPNHQDAAMNAGYVAQWWLFAVLTLVGFGYLARREARAGSPDDHDDRPLDRLAGLELDRTGEPTSAAYTA